MSSKCIKQASLINQATSFHPPDKSTDMAFCQAPSHIFGGSQHLSDSDKHLDSIKIKAAAAGKELEEYLAEAIATRLQGKS